MDISARRGVVGAEQGVILRPVPKSHRLAVVRQRLSGILRGSFSAGGMTSGSSMESIESGLLDYDRSDFRQYWMPDSRGKECYECQEKFTAFRRRHHCRICGQIFCAKCCNMEVPGALLGSLTISHRFCDCLVVTYRVYGRFATVQLLLESGRQLSINSRRGPRTIAVAAAGRAAYSAERFERQRGGANSDDGVKRRHFDGIGGAHVGAAREPRPIVVRCGRTHGPLRTRLGRRRPPPPRPRRGGTHPRSSRRRMGTRMAQIHRYLR